ncbi:UvrD-helicase domain-containing protein [Candidatus Woesebacteria bacterium]|nr:UvrD-helicase domain-containing protein [Candidatus Woesebacteria bacterium]
MTKTTKEFDLAYKKLNAEQRLAVDTIEGPVMLVAGPGTGKTQTLALRIANIIRKTDTPASSILALTYTESGARAMKSRLTDMIGSEAYYANISTFHAFCQGVIKDNPDVFTLNPASEPLSDLEKLKLIRGLIDNSSLTVLRPTGAPYHYASAILSAISDLKREGVDPDEFEELLIAEDLFLKSDDVSELKKTEIAKRQRNLAKNQELNQLFRKYQAVLKDEGSFDFEDMITSVVDAFKENEELLFSCQEKYLYILVDEYQDTNSAQNELMLLLAKYWGDVANVFVTGDPDQSIMRFQGASIENQLSFVKAYPNASVITLKQNYRSTQNILDVADSLISHNNLRINNVVPGIDPHLISVGAGFTPAQIGDKINVAELSGNTAEVIFIAEDIKQKVKSGVAPSDIAVIYHKNFEATVIADTLSKYGIDYTVQGGANVLSDPTVRNFLKILKVIYEMREKLEDEDLFTILHYTIFGINPLDVLKIARFAGDARLTLFDVLGNPDSLSTLDLVSRKQIDETFTKLQKWSAIDANKTFVEFFEDVLNKSGYLNWILDEGTVYKEQVRGAGHRLAKMNTLFDEVKRMNRSDHNLDLKGFIENLEIMEENHIRIEESSYGVSRDAITLTTAHKSKGLEWEHVYIYKAIDGNWGNNKKAELISLPETLLKNVKPSDKEKNEDERRLFYVAITRAKSSLTITRASTYSSYGKSQEASPTMFLEELNSDLLTVIDVTQVEETAHQHIETILGNQAVQDTPESEKAYLQDIVDDFKLAATSLNSYLFCAYKFKLDKLLKVPHAKKAHLTFGTAIHSALEHFYLKFKEDGVAPKLDYLLSQFRFALTASVITKADLNVYLKKGEEVLTAYFKLNQSHMSLPLATEKNLRANLGDIQLTGKLDRLEWSDLASRTVRVVDYKTGKPKTMGQIEGTTQDSDGELARQLEFYKLLIDSDKSLNYKFGEGMLDFVEEPGLKGKSGERRFQVSDEQIDELKKTIHQSMASIRSLQFPRTTDLKKCEKCYFLDHCYPSGLPQS